MTDENTNPDDDMIEIDGDHPWIQAALGAYPGPVETQVKFEPVELPNPQNPDGPGLRAALLTTVTPVGVQTVFVPPGAVAQLLQQAEAMFEFWDRQQRQAGPSLIVADKNMEAQAKAAHAATQKMRGQ